jgi:hypothetical protein
VSAIAELCERVLRASWAEGTGREGRPFAYTRPSPARYHWQWYWDSCFAAIVWRRIEPERSRAELETLMRAMRPDGFVGHVVFWDEPLSLQRSLFYNVHRRSDFMTGTIQPPLLAWAWRIAVGDPAQVPPIAQHHRWLATNRDLDGDGLIWLVQPDESGLDASPKFDPVWGWRAQGRLLFPLLVRRAARHDWDARRLLAAGGPVLCEVMTNVLWCLARMANGEGSITAALVDRCWDERRGYFRDQARPSGARPDVLTWSGLAPLALPDLPEEVGRRMVEEHLLDRGEFWLPVAPPSVAASEPSFDPGRGGRLLRRYWRGPTWINAAWMLWLGLVRLGYDEPARQMAETLAETVLRAGLREYFDPRDGTGLGATDFAWSTLILEMAEPDLEGARRSYL